MFSGPLKGPSDLRKVRMNMTFNPTNTDNISDEISGKTLDPAAVELVKLANGKLIMIGSTNSTSEGGIFTYEIDANGRVVGAIQNQDGPSDTAARLGTIDGGSWNDPREGYEAVRDIEAVTLSNGSTFCLLGGWPRRV